MRRACGDLVPGAGAQQGGVDHPASAQRAPPGRRGSRPCSRPSRRPRVAPCCPVTKPSARHGRSSTGERSPGAALSHRSRWPPAQTRRPCTSGRRRGRQGVQLSDVTRCDRDRMLGHHLDSAVLQDIDDAAAHGLPIGEIDVEGVAWPPSGLRLVHAESMRAPAEVHDELHHVGQRSKTIPIAQPCQWTRLERFARSRRPRCRPLTAQPS